MKKTQLPVLLLIILLCTPAFALDSDKDLRLDDNVGDSPAVILRDGADETMETRKIEAGGGSITVSEGPIEVAAPGPINIVPSGDVTKTFGFETLSSNMMLWFENAFSNKAGLRLNNANGQIEYRDRDKSSWMPLDWKVESKSADFSITADDHRKFFVVSNLTTATLPSAAAVGVDFMVAIKRSDALNDVIISSSNSETIDGEEKLRLKTQNGKVTLISDGSNWLKFDIFGNFFAYSISGGCPVNYVTVPANPLYGLVEDFCIAKYEMKFVAGVATSEPAGTPWVSINQTAAKAACTALGGGYHLVTNNEWMTTARNIENVPDNWQGGVVGTGYLNSGHNDNGPGNALAADADDTQACSGTGQTCSDVVWDGQRRTHRLSTGEVIWDFSGNVWDWVDWNVPTNDKANPQNAWIEINSATSTASMPAQSFYPENSGYNATNQRIGRYYPGLSGSGGAGLRGGGWGGGASAGVFALYLDRSSGASSTAFGFRCAWSPGG